jgi:hypothetical protein
VAAMILEVADGIGDQPGVLFLRLFVVDIL